MEYIFIPGNVPSLKNGKQWTGKFLVSSKTVQKYVKNSYHYWNDYRETFKQMAEGKDLPLKVHLKFIRDSKRKFDYSNALDTIQDCMTANIFFHGKKNEIMKKQHAWIEDDNADFLIPVLEKYEYNKNEPGVKIWVE